MDDYSRQINYIGEDYQGRIERSSAVVVGVGGLGSHVADQLVRLGLKRVMVLDPDRIEKSNIHRVALFTKKDIGKLKAKVVHEKLKKINSRTKIEYMSDKLTKENSKVFRGFDVVVDCSDNIQTRFVINEFCVKNGIPWIHGSCVGDEGFVASFKGKPCFSCLFHGKLPYHCDTEGIIVPTVGFVASLQVMEVAKITAGLADPLFGRLLIVGVKNPRFELLKIPARKDCEVCG